jgi:hypothetical protein
MKCGGYSFLGRSRWFWRGFNAGHRRRRGSRRRAWHWGLFLFLITGFVCRDFFGNIYSSMQECDFSIYNTDGVRIEGIERNRTIPASYKNLRMTDRIHYDPTSSK